MFKVLGPKVLITLLIMAAVTGSVAYGHFEHLVPMREQKTTELNALKAAIEARRREVAQLKEEYVLLKEQLEAFTQLGLQGFFNNQNRVEAQDSFNQLGELSGLLNTRYAISSGVLVTDQRAADAKYVLLRSPVQLDIVSLDDVDVYTFIKALQERFPGNVDILSVDLNRKMSVTAPILRQIGSGDPVKMVEAKVTFDWRTMAPQDKLDEFDTSTSQGEQGASAEPLVPAGSVIASPTVAQVPVSPSPQAVQ